LSARYLLRFDDLCPTMDRARWDRFELLIYRYALKPILAVVPENRDPDLMREAVDPAFWERMRRLQAAGATIGLHGLSHVCNAKGRSLIPLHRQTEFAGAVKEQQRAWIEAGIAILRRHNLEPGIWVAPRHGFDRMTLEALRESGIELVSDGFARLPFRYHGAIWIPQQLWGPVMKSDGVWTICFHANTASDETIEGLTTFLEGHSREFISVGDVLGGGPIPQLGLRDRLFHVGMLARIGIARWRKRVSSGSR
jgi:hypothetical protein